MRNRLITQINQNPKEVSHGLFHFIIDLGDKISLSEAFLLETILRHPSPEGSRAIIEIQSDEFPTLHSRDYIDYISRFNSVAYIMKSDIGATVLRQHVLYLRGRNMNAHYFPTYNEAYMWSMTHSQ